MNPLENGVFNSAKVYFVVCLKGTKVSIFLWRGRDQTLINWESAFQLFLDTKFRNVANSQRDRAAASRAASQISTTGLLSSGKLDLMEGTSKDIDDPLFAAALKSTFKPINQAQAITDPIML